MNSSEFQTFWENMPSDVDTAIIHEYTAALSPFYDVGNWLLPLPPWRKRPYEDSGLKAWETIRHDLTEINSQQPFCIYLHAPFCSSKCGFCDNYSFKLGNHQALRIQQYVDRLCYELRLWSEQGHLRERPVSTIHMGGGTPTFLGEKALSQIAECCRSNFSITPATEWALESTVHDLTPSMVQTMHDIGYRRLHLGVQSLQDDVRSTIGRQMPGSQVIETIERVLGLGWVVSVDLICGLPGQTLPRFMRDLETLIEVGVNGFSLYELLIYPQNIKWCAQHGLTDSRQHLHNYWMFLAGASILEGRGFHKNLFNHWADDRDANIYFTFPTRNEDLLAVGTIADGLFGDYHYRHPRYAQYLETAHSGLPGLQGGLRRDAAYTSLLPLTTAIQSGGIPIGQVSQLDKMSSADGAPLLTRWLDCKLVKPDGQGGWSLTPSGSWFTGNMLAELVNDSSYPG